MAFILSEQRDDDVIEAFERYKSYVAESRDRFPPGAFELASSEWYFLPKEHRCPHDGWLESLSVREPATGDRSEKRQTEIKIRLMGAYHDGYIDFVYRNVFGYVLNCPSTVDGLGDWRYDEFRLSSDGSVIHEIEWAGFPADEAARWCITASDVEFHWTPI